jgi:hypothetical protein
MAKADSGKTRQKAVSRSPEDLRHLLTAGSLVAAVLGTLILGAILRIDRDDGDNMPAAAPSTGGAGMALPTEIEPAVEPVGEVELARRANDDSRRLSTTANEWTLQFMVTCEQQTAQRILQGTGGDTRLHLLPVLVEDKDQPCFRICWGRYDSRERAVRNNAVPEVLLALNDHPIPREIRGMMP